MYLAYPAPDDGALAECLEEARRCAARRMAETPGVYRLGRRPPRLPARRRGSDNPLRLAVRGRAARPPVPVVKKEAPRTPEPEELLREALARARRRGWSVAALAEAVGLSEKTLRRHLSTPDVIPLGEYRLLMKAARQADGEEAAR